MSNEQSFSYESMGTHWRVSIFDSLEESRLSELRQRIVEASQAFDERYSRFKRDSLIWGLAEKTGVQEVPEDLVAMLRLYEQFGHASGGVFNPLVGHTLSDLGYDAEYSLTPQDQIRTALPFAETVQILDDTHINLKAHVLIDVGALGKGFFVDRIGEMLREEGVEEFFIDGSGDVLSSRTEPVTIALEHPRDPEKAIGTMELDSGSLCSSGANRRAWRVYHHIVEPRTGKSTEGIVASWVKADSAVVADALATALFLASPESFKDVAEFEYLLVNGDMKIKRSTGFAVELF